MANRKLDSLGLGPKALEPKGRPAGVTESSWCRGVVGGTGITVLALLLSKAPDVSALQTALHRLQTSHPILRSKLSHDAATNIFSYIIPSTSRLQLESFDATSTSHLLKRLPTSASDHLVSPFHRILEHELNRNPWSSSKEEHHKHPDTAVFFASLYALPDNNWVLALRLHTSVCDRTSAVTLLRELLVVAKEVKEGQLKGEQGKRGEFNVAIEELVPRGKANKTLWAHGVDLLAYSLKSLRFSNMDFKDSIAPRSSEVVRLQMKPDETRRLVAACEARGIKLCGALAAAGLMAAHLSKNLRDHQREKYAVATLMDCRSLLEPPLQSCNLGFYHSALQHTFDIKGGKDLWELATKFCMSLSKSIKTNKHFSDMDDLNFLMCKAIDNPRLTPSSALRLAVLSVFEDPVIDALNESYRDIGLEDYMGCSSVHGAGPSIAVFDTIRDGRLDCACVYPSPLHSREQMQELIDNMKRILVSWSD